MPVRFGTDGVRGRALTELTPEVAMMVGRACARTLGAERILIGRDPRRSGDMLEAALVAGIAAEGIDVDLLGVVPTPAVAWWARTEGCGAMMVTASHNPWTDNGIKVFGVGGRKLDDAQQAAIEHLCDGATHPRGDSVMNVGVARRDEAVAQRYIEAIVDAVGPGALASLHVVVDAANGAMGVVAGSALQRLGAQVEVIFDSLAGDDVNAGCGATYPQALSRHVVHRGADLGLAFDGDGDRVIAVDHRGHIVDGDRLIALAAWDRHRRGRLPGATVVVTVMTNLGFHRAMRAQGIEVVTTAVGDRQVLETMEQLGCVLGGEQSGHIIHHDLMPSGDGLLAGALLGDLVLRHGRPLADLADGIMTALPQVLLNVAVPPGRSHEIAQALADDVAEVEHLLGDEGRVLVRPSGTEPVLRIMIEASSSDAAQRHVEGLAARAQHLAGGTTPVPDAG
jgi:phosphoglucosamine mutase